MKTEPEVRAYKEFSKFSELAAQAINKYELKGKYDSNNKSVCLHIMDLQIQELRKINAEYVRHCNSGRGLNLRLHPDRFYTQYIAEAILHRDKLEQEIKEEEEALKKIMAMKWYDHLKADVSFWWKGVKEKFNVKRKL